MKQRCCLVFLALISTAIFFHSATQAETYKLYFNVVTTNYTDVNNRQVNADIILADTQFQQPDALGTLTVTAPGGKVFTYQPTDPVATKNLYWDETGDEFWFSAWASDFGGTIPSGKYFASVHDRSGYTITASETITVNFSLACPTITYPTAGSTVSSLTPKITWSAINGAKLYRVYLRYGNSAPYPPQYPIYPIGSHELRAYRNWVTIPKGVLLPQTNYMIRIEARDSDTNYNQRARSDWVSFTTP